MFPTQLLGVVSTWLILAICIIESATDENLSMQRYLPASDEQVLSTNKRIQQIMQDGGSIADVSWPQPKLKTEKINVKAEIAKLNTSYLYQSNWPDSSIKLGSVTAVSFDKAGNVVIFHRVDRIWEQSTFDNENVFPQRKKGPIRNSTVLAFDRKSGKVIYDWGKNLFYMPHGLHIDQEDNVWVTDVALHQVFKFGPRGSNDKPLMTLGIAFQPGAGETKFCKPTSVAVLENGDFFVADGYCNARILKYSKEGTKILSWGQNSFAGLSYEVAPRNFFAIPHALTLVPDQELVCAADRENGRVQCFFCGNGTFHSQYHSQIIGDRLFSMDYTPAEGGQLVIVNGPTAELGIKPEHYNEVRGYILNFKSKQVVSKFGPNDLQFENPHDVAVTVDGSEIYVAELDPTRIHKFVHKTVAKSMPISAAKPTATRGVGPEYELSSAAQFSIKTNGNETDSVAEKESSTQNHHRPGGTAILVASLMLLFAFLTFALALLVARRRKREKESSTQNHHRPGGTAILVASLMLLFAFLTFALALLVARRRKRGCLPFGVKNRRHAWDFPTKPEGFKLGGLLMDRSKRVGFEKLDQNASDEEGDASTNMLSGAQFA